MKNLEKEYDSERDLDKRQVVDLRNMEYYQSLLYSTRSQLERKKNDLEMMLIDKAGGVKVNDVRWAEGVYQECITILDWLKMNKDYGKFDNFLAAAKMEMEVYDKDEKGGSYRVETLAVSIKVVEKFLAKVEKYVDCCDMVFDVEQKKKS